MPALRKRGPMHEINIVPYVDVMLVLLVIFMVTAPLVTPAVIDLPTVDKASQPRIVPLEVFVKADRGLVVRSRDTAGAIVSERTVSRGELAQALKEVRGQNAELAVPEKPKPKPKPKPVPAKRALAFERQLREQAAAEEKQLQDRMIRDQAARAQADLRSRALAQWTDKIRAKIRGNIILPQDIP